MKNLKFDQFYKEKSLFMIKRSQNFRLRRAKQTTDREIHCLKIISAKIVHMAKSRKKTLALREPRVGVLKLVIRSHDVDPGQRI